MVINTEFKKREYVVQFSLFQPEEYLKELDELRKSLPGILKNHRVNVFTESQNLGTGFHIFLYVLLRETGQLDPKQCAIEEGRLLAYVEKLVGKRYTTEPKSLDETQKSLFYARFSCQSKT